MDAGRQDLARQLTGKAPAFPDSAQQATVDEQVEKLSQEEGVALRPAEQDIARDGVELRSAEIGTEQALGGRVVQRGERQHLQSRHPVPPRLPEHVGTSSRDEQHRSRQLCDELRHRTHQVFGGPLRIVDDEHQWAVGDQRSEHRRNRVDKRVP